jgi:subtilisin
MPRYVFASRRASGGGSAAAAERWLGELGAAVRPLAATLTRGRRPKFIAVLEADAEQIARLQVPETMILEPEISHEIAAPPFMLRLRGRKAPLGNALALARFHADDDEREEYAEADADGVVQFPVDPAAWSMDMVFVKPRHSYWTRVAVELDAGNVLQLEPLPSGPLGWWHAAVGITAHDARRGEGIRVGVLDTGCGPNGCLDHVHDAGAIQHLAHDPVGEDTDGHGTHVCGLIGARPTGPAHFAGTAPGVNLISIRVCDVKAKTNQADMTAALDLLREEHEVDLVNLSLAADTQSEILHEAVLDLRDSGVLAICAAGNAAGPVWFPAAMEEAVAVSAIGLLGGSAPFSVSYGQRPDEAATDRFGSDGFYVARFSCAGPEVTCAAPGVGILSTVPSVFIEPVFAEMDGTSMASPIACGVLAARLARDREYRSMARDERRAARALEVLAGSCRDIGLAAEFQGRGVPQV